MAEREGFEPSVTMKPHRFSRPAHSAALASLQSKIRPGWDGRNYTGARGLFKHTPASSAASSFVVLTLRGKFVRGLDAPRQV